MKAVVTLRVPASEMVCEEFSNRAVFTDLGDGRIEVTEIGSFVIDSVELSDGQEIHLADLFDLTHFHAVTIYDDAD